MTGLWYVGLLSTDGPTGTLHVFDRSHVAGLVSADIDRVQGPAEAFTLASTLSARPPIDLMRQRLECLATSHLLCGHYVAPPSEAPSVSHVMLARNEF